MERLRSAVSGLALGEVLQKRAESGAISGCAAADGRSSGVLPKESRFTVLRTGETGVLWCRFRDQKGNSGS